MRALVTGGCGFFGTWILRRLLDDGDEPLVFDIALNTKRWSMILTPDEIARVQFAAGEIDGPAFSETVRTFAPEAILHLAGLQVPACRENPLAGARVNVLGTIALLEAARAAGVKRFVFVSSGGAVYGEQETFPAPETHPTWPVSPYGVSKRSGELYAHFFQAQYGLPFVALRYANVYGPRQDPHGEAGVVAIFAQKMLRDEPVTVNGDGGQTRDYVYVGDVARMSLLAIGHDASGPVNVGTGIETDVNALATQLRDVVGSSAAITHGPAKAGEQRRSVVDVRRAASVYGWRPEVTLVDGLRRTVEFFRTRVAGAGS